MGLCARCSMRKAGHESAYAMRAFIEGYVNSVEKLGGKKIQGRMLVYENLPSPYSGAILFSKVNMGLEKLIDKKDWAEVEDPTRSG